MYKLSSKLIALSFILLSTWACAVKPAPYIGFSYGASLPIGQYRSKDVKQGTFATNGRVFALDFGKYHSAWGWTGTISSANHPIDRKAFQYQLNKDGVEGRPNDSSKWMVSNVMGGVSYGKTYGKFTIEVRVLAGIMFAKSPSMTVKDETVLNTDYRKFYNYLWDCVGALGSQMGMSMRYQMSKHWQARANVNIYQSKMTYKSVQEAIPEKNQQATVYHYTLPVKVLDLSLGINYRFPSH